MEHFWNGWSSYIPWSLWCLIRNLTGFIFCRQHGHLWQPSLLLVQRLICLLNFVIPVLMIRFLYTFIKFWLFLKKSCVILIEKLLFIHVLKIYYCIKIDLWLTCIWFFCAIILLKSRQSMWVCILQMTKDVIWKILSIYWEREREYLSN